MLGLGVDVVAVARWRRLLCWRGGRLVSRVFAPEELARCRGPRAAERLAARWAAKEAVAKALGCRPGPWRDVVIESGPGGEPRVLLRGAWAEAARARGVTACHVSLTHEGRLAAAVAVALALGGGTAREAAGERDSETDARPEGGGAVGGP